MPRGRKAIPDAIKQLKGNPGHRKLALQGAFDQPSPAKGDRIEIPDFLTHPREQEIFRRVVEDYMQRRIAREVDLISYGRWASYIHGWWQCKELLDGKAKYMKQKSNHVERYVETPIWRLQMQYEKLARDLEDRLGLNPAARQSILRGLAAMPPSLGELIGENIDHDKEQKAPMATEEETDSPLGFLHRTAH